MNHYFKVGKLAASHGLKGDLILQHSLGKKTSFKGLESVFLEEKTDSFLPYFVEWVKIKSETEVYIKLEGVNDKETARKLTPRELWLTEADFMKYAAKSSPIALLGFHIINEAEDLGEILEVIEQPHQVLVAILLHGKEALIPIHEGSLEKVDTKNRKVYVNLPDGLLEIYK